MHCLKSLLFNDSDLWIKTDGNQDFDVTRFVLDELVGFYILYILSTKYGKNLNRLYRHDGLACFENISGPQADRIRKDFINIFRKEFQLKIVCESNLKIVNILDVTLYLTTGKYKPYNKPGLYNSALSNSGFKDKTKFNPDCKISVRISVGITRRKEKLYSLILHIAAMFPPILVKVF